MVRSLAILAAAFWALSALPGCSLLTPATHTRYEGIALEQALAAVAQGQVSAVRVVTRARGGPADRLFLHSAAGGWALHGSAKVEQALAAVAAYNAGVHPLPIEVEWETAYD